MARYNLGIAYLRSGDLVRAREQMATIPRNDRLYEPAARNIVVIDGRIADEKRSRAAAPNRTVVMINSVLKYWTPIAVAVPILLLYLFRRRVQPSIVVEFGMAGAETTAIRVRNTSAADVSVFGLNVKAYSGERELGSLTSDLAPNNECLLPVEVDTGGSIRVVLVGVYYLFPRVRLGAFRFRRTVSPTLVPERA